MEKLSTLSEEQIVADELALFAQSLQDFKKKQAHDTVFLRLCAGGKYFDVKGLIQAKADVNQADEDGRTGMHHAASAVRTRRRASRPQQQTCGALGLPPPRPGLSSSSDVMAIILAVSSCLHIMYALVCLTRTSTR